MLENYMLMLSNKKNILRILIINNYKLLLTPTPPKEKESGRSNDYKLTKKPHGA